MGVGPFGPPISQLANDLLRGRANKTLLEAGCGTASYFTFEGIVKSVGIDIDEGQLQKNKHLNEKIHGDIETYPLPKDSFDVVVCWDVIEHLSHPQQALLNIFNALKPGALIILSFPNLLSFKGIVTKITPFWFHEAFYRFMKYTSRHFPTYLRFEMVPSRVIDLAQRNGLIVVYKNMVEGSLTMKVRKRFWALNILFRLIDAIWRFLTLGRCDSLFIDSCILILRKDSIYGSGSI